jgi:hypothetical protein
MLLKPAVQVSRKHRATESDDPIRGKELELPERHQPRKIYTEDTNIDLYELHLNHRPGIFPEVYGGA